MNSDKKESIAITAIINEVNKYDNLFEDLKKRDKEPVWDGCLNLYRKDSSKNTDIVAKIPVQVKGTDAKNNEKGVFYDAEIENIKNYRKTNMGTIFFVVEIDKKRKTKIYYKVFDLKTIEEILTEDNLKKKTKRFKFEELKNNQLVTICIDFINKLDIYKNVKPLHEIEVYDKKTICYDYNTKYELGEIKKSNEVFYETNAYKEAKAKLEKQNIIILHGEPWVGKTSTARKLVEEYIKKGYIFIYGNVDDLVEIKEKIAIDEKIICLIDDFLGSNIQYLEKNIAESTLDRIVKIVKNSKDKKLILTTRTYIYNNAKELFYKFHHATSIKDEYLIDVANYTYLEKGNIFYNHMKKNNLIGTDKHSQLVDGEFYSKVISHENFNPGVIALICERLREKKNVNVQEYIKNALNSPDQLWDEEYQKLTNYEKMILIIIVLFGVKVPEEYVQEQFTNIIKNEKIHIEVKEIFSKSLHALSNAFIKVTFNSGQERELEVCKHSVSDYIINKIKDGKVDINRYIESASYAEVLSYINRILDNNLEIEERIAQKVEVDIWNIKDFFYDGIIVSYHILLRRLNKKREEILKKIIEREFYFDRSRLIFDILEDDKNIFYPYTKELFKKYIIEGFDDDFVYGISYVTDYEIFLKTCSEILEYRKNSECMIDYLEAIRESLIEVIASDVEAEINDTMMEYVAKDIIKGKDLNDIINEYIEATVHDELPSLRNLYSKKIYNDIIENLYEYCYIDIDKQQLEDTIKELKEKKKNPTEEESEEKVYVNYVEVDKEQVKSVKEKFEKGVTRKNKKEDIDKGNNESYYDFIQKFDIEERFTRKWWIDSFFDENDLYEFKNIKLYYEFAKKQKIVDKSLLGLAKQFLEYLLHEKNKISSKSEKLLAKIAYNSFLEGDFVIDNNYLKQCEKKYPENMLELYNSEVIIKKDEGYMFINKYIHLYIAINELVKKQANLLIIICEWEKLLDEKLDDIYDEKQKILQLYSEIEPEQFNKLYLIPALKIFINDVKNRYKKMGKINTTKAIMDLLELELHLDRRFKIIGGLQFRYPPIDFVEFVTGIDLNKDMQFFDYGIYQKMLREKCFNEKIGAYILDFSKMLREKDLKEICDKLKICDYIYDMYKSCEKTLELLENDNKCNAYNIEKESLYKKYRE